MRPTSGRATPTTALCFLTLSASSATEIKRPLTRVPSIRSIRSEAPWGNCCKLPQSVSAAEPCGGAAPSPAGAATS